MTTTCIDVRSAVAGDQVDACACVCGDIEAVRVALSLADLGITVEPTATVKTWNDGFELVMRWRQIVCT